MTSTPVLITPSDAIIMLEHLAQGQAHVDNGVRGYEIHYYDANDKVLGVATWWDSKVVSVKYLDTTILPIVES